MLTKEIETMVVTLNLPDNLAHALTGSTGRDLSRRALEALAVDGYRDDLLTGKQVGELLGLSRMETEDFLAAHLDLCDYDPAELTREAEQLKRFSELPPESSGLRVSALCCPPLAYHP